MKECPSHKDFIRTGGQTDAYESAAGGYGYNNDYVGSRARWGGDIRTGARTTEIKAPAGTVMFADAAMARGDSNGEYLIEESFVYPPYWSSQPINYAYWPQYIPTMHFRHGGLAEIAWCDGHVDSRSMSFSYPGQTAYGGHPQQWNLGWYGPKDNSLFGEP